MLLKFALSLLTFLTLVLGQTNLSGSIGGMTLTRDGNPFVVSKDIVITAGKQVTIREGCIILFEPFTGIVVDGSLAVEGTAENPVVFTSVNDTTYGTQREKGPEPFDWNGIHLKQRARDVQLSHFILTYSVYGIKSQIEDVVIDHGTFDNNGQYHFTVNDVIKPVTEELPYSYNERGMADVPALESPKSTTAWRRPVSIAAILLGAGGGGFCGYSLYREREFRALYDNNENSPDEFDSYSEKQQTWRNYAVAAGSAGGTLLIAGAALFVYDYLTGKHPAVSVIPRFGRESGLCMVIPLHICR